VAADHAPLVDHVLELHVPIIPDDAARTPRHGPERAARARGEVWAGGGSVGRSVLVGRRCRSGLLLSAADLSRGGAGLQRGEAGLDLRVAAVVLELGELRLQARAL